MIIASKFEDAKPLSIFQARFQMCRGEFTASDLITQEALILKALDYRVVSRPTVFEFLHICLTPEITRYVPNSEVLMSLCIYIAALAMYEYQIVGTVRPSLLALASVNSALTIYESYYNMRGMIIKTPTLMSAVATHFMNPHCRLETDCLSLEKRLLQLDQASFTAGMNAQNYFLQDVRDLISCCD